MVEQKTQIEASARVWHRINVWSIGAFVIAFLVVLPILSILWLAFTPEENAWPHLMATTLPRYVTNTVVISLSVGIASASVGTGAAWLITMYRFPGARWLEWLLLTPLAIPAYVGAYALVDFLEYAGPLQTGLRTLFGWETARDYWFPEIRSRWAAIIVLAAALNPYVFLLARAAFREQSADAYEVARALGAGPFARFWRVGLPLARPAIAAGVAIVMMETVSDFGVVDYFAVQTLTTGIFTVWLEGHNAGGAAQIALVILGFVLVLAALEKIGRSKSRFYRMSRQSRPVEPRQLGRWSGLAAFTACAIPFAIGFVLPVIVLFSHAVSKPEYWLSNGLFSALVHTLTVGSVAALVSVLGALFLVYGVRLSGSVLARKLMPITTIGYAAPGAVLGIGILIPMAAADNAMADGILAVTGWDPGLVMTGTAFAVIYAYCVRFFAIAQGASDAAFERVSPNIPMAARSLGRSARGTLIEVYFPLIRGSVGTALLLVFVDSVKELPATLLLRPFNYGTLATRVYEQASLEQLGQAAPPALMVISVGLCAVALMARASRR
ncbi:iron(III) transport system permease protein [Aliiroseovarius halocynthiae]|uniref:Iron ABC transporter permease n=1 Tax=Aliiroseovarius halocynthiae TaxID=985055 RepID=A0A545SLZ9_9RHOB|nr:iron ABC transporter permease [Aliiroseovarius halocynthiae]TQV66007.1 iron ABC transporter permease [Aliiroseovarius halocynthiae]SMR83290.1 iron(III) transport system permease protein [Aliiroseovarius halocynthiae]